MGGLQCHCRARTPNAEPEGEKQPHDAMQVKALSSRPRVHVVLGTDLDAAGKESSVFHRGVHPSHTRLKPDIESATKKNGKPANTSTKKGT